MNGAYPPRAFSKEYREQRASNWKQLLSELELIAKRFDDGTIGDGELERVEKMYNYAQQKPKGSLGKRRHSESSENVSDNESKLKSPSRMKKGKGVKNGAKGSKKARVEKCSDEDRQAVRELGLELSKRAQLLINTASDEEHSEEDLNRKKKNKSAKDRNHAPLNDVNPNVNLSKVVGGSATTTLTIDKSNENVPNSVNEHTNQSRRRKRKGPRLIPVFKKPAKRKTVQYMPSRYSTLNRPETGSLNATKNNTQTRRVSSSSNSKVGVNDATSNLIVIVNNRHTTNILKKGAKTSKADGTSNSTDNSKPVRQRNRNVQSPDSPSKETKGKRNNKKSSKLEMSPRQSQTTVTESTNDDAVFKKPEVKNGQGTKRKASSSRSRANLKNRKETTDPSPSHVVMDVECIDSLNTLTTSNTVTSVNAVETRHESSAEKLELQYESSYNVANRTRSRTRNQIETDLGTSDNNSRPIQQNRSRSNKKKTEAARSKDVTENKKLTQQVQDSKKKQQSRSRSNKRTEQPPQSENLTLSENNLNEIQDSVFKIPPLPVKNTKEKSPELKNRGKGTSVRSKSKSKEKTSEENAVNTENSNKESPQKKSVQKTGKETSPRSKSKSKKEKPEEKAVNLATNTDNGKKESVQNTGKETSVRSKSKSRKETLEEKVGTLASNTEKESPQKKSVQKTGKETSPRSKSNSRKEKPEEKAVNPATNTENGKKESVQKTGKEMSLRSKSKSRKETPEEKPLNVATNTENSHINIITKKFLTRDAATNTSNNIAKSDKKAKSPHQDENKGESSSKETKTSPVMNKVTKEATRVEKLKPKDRINNVYKSKRNLSKIFKSPEPVAPKMDNVTNNKIPFVMLENLTNSICYANTFDDRPLVSSTPFCGSKKTVPGGGPVAHSEKVEKISEKTLKILGTILDDRDFSNCSALRNEDRNTFDRVRWIIEEDLGSALFAKIWKQFQCSDEHCKVCESDTITEMMSLSEKLPAEHILLYIKFFRTSFEFYRKGEEFLSKNVF